MKNQWKRDVAGLASVTGVGLLAAVALLPCGNTVAVGFGVEGLMVALMFVSCLAWRLLHREG